MSDFTWGDLPKSQIDNQLISEAITEAINAHEADPEAHLGDGQSLEAHKSNEIIDHPAQSVVDDKPRKNKFTLESYFENITCFDITGSAFNYLGYIELSTTTVLNNKSYLLNRADDAEILTPNLAQSPIFELVGKYHTNFNYEGYFGIENPNDVGLIGFKAVGTDSWAVWHDIDEVEHLISLSGINPKVIHKWRIEVVAGEAIYWIIDNNQVASLDLTIYDVGNPMSGIMFGVNVKTLESGHAALFAGYRILYQQDLFGE